MPYKDNLKVEIKGKTKKTQMGKQVKRNIHTFQSSKDVIREENYDILSISNSTMEDSDESTIDFSSDYAEDVSSSSSTSSSTDGPLFQLSNLMDQLPIKRGLSKYYQGKSQSFAALGSVSNLEDLVKRENPYQKRMKLCKSLCERLTSPKATISKKASYSTSRMRRKCSNNFMPTCGLPPISTHKD